MKVLQLLLSPRIGGAETLVESLEAEFLDGGLHSMVAYVDPAGTRSSSPVRRVQRLRAQIREFGPDVVLSHSAIPNVYARLAWAGPVVTVLHSASDDFADWRLRGAEHLLAMRTAAVVAVSAQSATVYHARFRLGPRVIPNGVRPQFAPAQIELREIPRVVCCARLSAQKDPETWFAIAARVRELSGCRFAWYGPDEGGMKSGSFPAGVSDEREEWRNDFSGPTAAPWSMMAQASLYLHTATREAHPIALLEAAAVGVPIICTNDVAASLPAGLPAATFAAGDVDGGSAVLLDCLARLPELRRRAIMQSLAVRNAFDMKQCAVLYRQVLAEAARTGRRKWSPRRQSMP